MSHTISVNELIVTVGGNGTDFIVSYPKHITGDIDGVPVNGKRRTSVDANQVPEEIREALCSVIDYFSGEAGATKSREDFKSEFAANADKG